MRHAGAAQPASRDTFLAIAQDVSWFVASSVCLGLGEFRESSYYIAVLEWGRLRSSRRDAV